MKMPTKTRHLVFRFALLIKRNKPDVKGACISANNFGLSCRIGLNNFIPSSLRQVTRCAERAAETAVSLTQVNTTANKMEMSKLQMSSCTDLDPSFWQWGSE